jgi:hypothetical protein
MRAVLSGLTGILGGLNLDGYVELYRFPDILNDASKDDAERYFDSTRREYFTPCAYDCTGQRLTNWRRLFRRRGRWYAYHFVSVDM